MKKLLTGGILSVLLLAAQPGQAQTKRCVTGDCQNGYGTLHYPNGNRYRGNFQNGKPHGQGILYFANGAKHLGTYVNERREGRGKLIYHDGAEYEGQFRADRRSGTGEMRYANGNVYTGDWRNDRQEGTGKMTFHNGDQYTGTFQNGKFHGAGTMTYADGQRYQGNWADNRYHGLGVLHKPDGSKTTAEYTKGSLARMISVDNPAAAPAAPALARNCNKIYCDTGLGTYRYSGGAVYQGSFKAGQPSGSGELHYPNGDFYKGGWDNNGPFGRGVMHYANGRTVGGIWSEGQLLRYLYANDEVMEEQEVMVDRDPEVKIFAVIVGVGDYEYNRKLNFTLADANAMNTHLQSPRGGAVPPERIALLLDEEATRENILAQTQRMLWQADENDVIIFYFSGHGLQDQFLPIDFDGYHNRLQHQDIRTIMAKSEAKHKIVLADACFSGSLMRSKTPHGGADHRYFNAFEASEGGIAFFLSSTEDEESMEDNHIKGGVFTHFLLEGMRGKADTYPRDGLVTISELFPYVRKKVTRYTAHRQTPVLLGKYADDLPMSALW